MYIYIYIKYRYVCVCVCQSKLIRWSFQKLRRKEITNITIGLTAKCCGVAHPLRNYIRPKTPWGIFWGHAGVRPPLARWKASKIPLQVEPFWTAGLHPFTRFLSISAQGIDIYTHNTYIHIHSITVLCSSERVPKNHCSCCDWIFRGTNRRCGSWIWQGQWQRRKRSNSERPMVVGGSLCHYLLGLWFGTFFIFSYIGNDHPNWLIFFRWVETTNQLQLPFLNCYCRHC